MKLYNTKDNPEFVGRIIEYCGNRTSWEYGYDHEWYKGLAEDANDTAIDFVYDENTDSIVSILSCYPRFEKMIWRIGENEERVIQVLINKYPNGFFVSGNGYYLKKAGLYPAACNASYDENVIYPAIANAGIWTNNPDMVTNIRDWLENKYLEPVDNWMDKIEYRWINVNEFASMFYDSNLIDWPFHRNNSGHYSYIGFHYMNWDYTNDHTWYLVAIVNNKPIGCICVQKFERYGYYAVSYIDVSAPYKNNGVAKKMIHELTKIIPGDLPLLLSMESKEGNKCHIHECFKRETWPNACVTQEEFDEMCRKKVNR